MKTPGTEILVPGELRFPEQLLFESLTGFFAVCSRQEPAPWVPACEFAPPARKFFFSIIYGPKCNLQNGKELSKTAPKSGSFSTGIVLSFLLMVRVQ
jgi:hypothetical protein